MKHSIKISVVTVVYNGEKYIEDTIKSVINQTYKNIEYIIIDGNSTDNTVNIIKKYEKSIDCWTSEKDDGIYDAMNKGIDIATGDVISFLNADDWYEKEALEKVANEFINNSDVDFVYGQVRKVDIDGNDAGLVRMEISEYKRLMPLAHPGFFIKTKYHKNRKFDLTYKIAADYDFVLEMIKNGLKYKKIDYILNNFRLVGVSSINNTNDENFKIHIKHYSFLHALNVKMINFLLSNFWLIVDKLISNDVKRKLKSFMKKV